MRGLWVGVSLIDHWIGPILGRVDLGLSDELRTAFAALHRRPRPLAPESIHAVLEADLGAAARELVDSMQLDPLAADPIGQTYGATLADGTPVAVKIRDADIFEEVDRDLTPATLSARLAPWFPASAQLDALAADLHARALDACDYALAAQRQDRLWWLFANHPTIVVPTVHRAWSSPRVLTTTVVGGQALDAWLQSHHPDQSARDRIGEALFDLYLGALFQHGLCKADADPGNYRLLADGRVALVDFGSMRELAPPFVASLAALTHAVWSGDRDLLQRTLVELGAPLPAGEDPEQLWALLQAAYGPMLRDELAAFELDSHQRLADEVQRWREAPGPVLSADIFFVLRLALDLLAVLGKLGASGHWKRRLQTLLLTLPSPTYDVVLLEPGSHRIAMMRELRDATGLPLREVDYLMIRCPQTVRPALVRDEAEALRVRLENAGGRVEVKLTT